MNDLTIVSTVAVGDIGAELKLGTLSDDLDVYSCRYNPTDSPGLYLQFYKSGPTITLFRTGSFNIRGSSSNEEIQENKELLENEFSKMGIDTSIGDANLTNIVFTANLDKQVDLNRASIKLGLERIEYEPEQFPGLVYRLELGVVLIFSSGNLVLTGFTEIEDAQQAYNKLKLELEDD